MSRLITLSLILITISCSDAALKNTHSASMEMTIINTNTEGKGAEVRLDFYKGKSFYYPLMAAWLEDSAGNFIQTLYVPLTVASGIFKYGKQEAGKWVASRKRAPQILPYWSHKRGIAGADGIYMPGPENPVPDAYTGATPAGSFTLLTRSDNTGLGAMKIMFEINQNWDWNEYWTNDKFPGDENYKASCQPALVYEATIDMKNHGTHLKMKPVGHSHPSGKTGELFTDLTTLTTALEIADSIIVTVR